MITQSISQQEIEKQIQEHIEKVENKIIEALTFLGEMCQNEAKSGYTYTPRSGNLLSSVGYNVLKDGRPVASSNFEGSDEGVKKGKEMIESLHSKFPEGLALIVVAGMEYAGYVEAIGFNVLVSSELLAERELPGLMKKLGFEIVEK